MKNTGGVAVVSEPLVDADNDDTAETYGNGEEIRVRLTFDGAVDVDTSGRTPRLKIKMDPMYGEKWAVYESGSGTASLEFAYTVLSANLSPQGIAVLENTLELNGGTIKAEEIKNALLGHAGLGHDADHKIDHTQTPPLPEFLDAAVDGAALTVSFSQKLGTGSAPAGSTFEVTATSPGGTARTITGTGTAAISGATASVTLALAVAFGETVMASYTAPSANPLQNLGGAAVQSLSRKTVTNDTPRPPPPPPVAIGAPMADAGTDLEVDPEASVTVRDLAPAFGAAAVSSLVSMLDETMAPVVLPEVTGGNGDLTYTLTSEPPDLAGPSFDAASVPASGLTLAGKNVRFGANGEGGDGEPGCAPDAAMGREGIGADGEGCTPSVQDIAESELLGSSAFSRTLGADGETGASETPLWAVWGRGDLGSFAGRPEPGTSYEGELRTGWLGIDARAGPWVAGIALSHGIGEAEYSFRDGGTSGYGRLETTLTALHPYGRWIGPDGLELRGVLGAGRGEARHWPDGGERETSDLSMWMGSLGVGRPLPANAGFDLAARADASVARMETAAGPDDVDGLTADSWRLRAGVEASRRITLGEDASLTPFVEAATSPWRRRTWRATPPAPIPWGPGAQPGPASRRRARRAHSSGSWARRR